MNFRFISFCSVLIIALISCKKHVSFPVRIVNESGFDIENVSFYGTVSGESTSVNANDTSETIIASYQRRVRLTPKLLRLVIDIGNQANAYSVVRHMPTFPFSKQSLNDDINTIIITSELSNDTLIFSSTLE